MQNKKPQKLSFNFSKLVFVFSHVNGKMFSTYVIYRCSCVCVLCHVYVSSVIRLKDESQNGCYKTTKHINFPKNDSPFGLITDGIVTHL